MARKPPHFYLLQQFKFGKNTFKSDKTWCVTDWDGNFIQDDLKRRWEQIQVTLSGNPTNCSERGTLHVKGRSSRLVCTKARYILLATSALGMICSQRVAVDWHKQIQSSHSKAWVRSDTADRIILCYPIGYQVPPESKTRSHEKECWGQSDEPTNVNVPGFIKWIQPQLNTWQSNKICIRYFYEHDGFFPQ